METDMTTLTHTHSLPRFGWPRLTWRKVLDRLVALDALHRERANLRRVDENTLRDIGVTRADLEATLSQPAEHMRLILQREGDEFQH
jgi:uncharacterized protein YjiS (DUF1127 family)